MNCRFGLRAGFYPSIATPPKLGEKQCGVARLWDVPSARWMPSLQQPHKLTASRWSPGMFPTSRCPRPFSILGPTQGPRAEFLVCTHPLARRGTGLEILTRGKGQRQDTREAYTVRRLVVGLEVGVGNGNRTRNRRSHSPVL